jgi:miniconductance mechanosensitive channel
MLEFINDYLLKTGLHSTTASTMARAAMITLVIALIVLASFVAKRLILSGLRRLIGRTETKKDDVFLEKKVLDRLSQLVPPSVIYIMAPFALEGYEGWIDFTQNSAVIYMIIISSLVADAFLNAVLDIYRTLEISKEIPIKGFVQIIKVATYIFAVIFIIAIIFNKTPLYLLSGLGALTAVLMLIFKDAILGFVAGIQLAANKMVSHGDWIEMPRYGADGDVLEVALTTVKVQNWDKTITTIPTYALISESFKNWRGMQTSGGRRIKRSIYIDINTINFCTDEMVERFSRIRYIAEYMAKKKKALAEHNAAHMADNSNPANRRQLTNIGTFRAYVVAYLGNHPMINQEMTFLIRQLAPSEHGLPIEIYVFCKDKVWANYEAIQADIFDHILSIVPEFDLKVFQTPAGSDFRNFTAQNL